MVWPTARTIPDMLGRRALPAGRRAPENRSRNFGGATLAALVALGMVAAAVGPSVSSAGTQHGRLRQVAVSATLCGYDPNHVEANRNDLITVLFHAGDVAHSFVIDDYRIAKRAQAGETVTVEFYADRPGTFAFYCNIEHRHRCAPSDGVLIVH